ncbi:hypothetical protein RFI_04332 [Reticulomyxa filosa]|uniref:Uncharacterized protein n=1 Tax=Reticulomyxa filosa TaxID=46433 RepID=X6P2K0_RETFI|nr:hypothetical protein RFI_04332 [Reticulomyxa filosa]|eukprot:ETO32785.1 hypothetical protein RFI_04332 [Reticulomyxa filosa]
MQDTTGQDPELPELQIDSEISQESNQDLLERENSIRLQKQAVFVYSIILVVGGIILWIVSLVWTANGHIFDFGVVAFIFAIITGVLGIYCVGKENNVGNDKKVSGNKANNQTDLHKRHFKKHLCNVHCVLLPISHIMIVLSYAVNVIKQTDGGYRIYSLIFAVTWGLSSIWTIQASLRFRSTLYQEKYEKLVNTEQHDRL